MDHSFDFSFADGIGLLGSVIIVGAYYLATRKIWPADQIRFNESNIAGGVLVMISLIDRTNLGAIVIKVMFLLIATLAIWRNLRKTS